MKVLVLVFFGITLFVSVLQAQNLSVTGVVKDTESGISLPGVNVSVKGTSQGTVTNMNGVFEVNVTSLSDTLVFSSVGYLSQEVAINGRSELNVELRVNIEELGELIVVGFGTSDKINLTGAVSSINLDNILGDRPVISAAEALQGAAAGLQVVSTSGRPGASGTSLNIRGFTSINGAAPLVLVDNIPMAIDNINPRDIESVSVLKDASATAIYGARAAFGVILITTKKAQRNQPLAFNYSTTTSFSSPVALPEKATTREFVEALNDWGVNRYFANQEVSKWLEYLDQYDADPSQLQLIMDPINNTQYPLVMDSQSGIYYPLGDSDVFGTFLDNSGVHTIHNMEMSGGSDMITFRLSGGYSYEDGIMVTNRDTNTQYNVSGYIGAEITSRLRSETNIYYKNSDRMNPTARYNTAVQIRMYDPTGYFELPNGDVLPFATPNNIVKYNTPGQTSNENLRLFQRFNLNPLENLNIVGEYTYEQGTSQNQAINNQPRFVSNFLFAENSTNPENTSIRRTYGQSDYNALNIYSRYNQSFKNHQINLLAGFNRENRINQNISAFRRNFISTEVPSINTAIGDFDASDSYNEWRVLGFFGRVNYNFNNKYLFEASGRYDGSSRFPEGSRFGFFPSFSAGWNIDQESFMDVFEFANTLKLRGSWGEVGNQNIANLYPAFPGFDPYQARWINQENDLRHLTLNPALLVSAFLTWERVQTTNIGFDLGVLRNRLTASLDVYIRKTLDMLIPGEELPAVLGTSAPFANAADLETKGWELELSWNDQIRSVNYGFGFNIFDSQTKITKFNNPAGLISQFYVGQKIGEIWGYKTDGYYTVDDFVEGTLDAFLSGPDRQLKQGVVYIENAPTPYPGDIKYVDLNGDGVINDGNQTLADPGDRTVIGNSQARYQFGFNGYAMYRSFDFSFVLSGVAKRDLNLNSPMIWPFRSQFEHIYKHQLDYWTPDNQEAFYPRIYGDPLTNTGSNYSRSRFTQTKYLYNGAQLRVRNITLGYTMPLQLINQLNITNLRLFLSGENLFTFDYLPKGMNPDQSDNGAYPFMRKISFGLNLTF